MPNRLWKMNRLVGGMKLRVLGFFFLCVVIGFSLIVQARVTNGQQLYVSAKTITDYETTIESEKKDKDRIGQLIEETGKRLQEYEALANNGESELKDKLVEELDNYKLISGQYAANSRPSLEVQENHANLKMDRAATPWLSFADWNTALARDVPWSLFVTTHLGQAQVDLSGLVMQRAVIASGFGDIRLVCPEEAFEPLYVRSALGNIHVIVPPGLRVEVRASGARTFRVHSDPARFEAQGNGVYLARNAEHARALIEIDIRGTFGDAYLA